MKTETDALLSLRAKYQSKLALIDEALAELGHVPSSNHVQSFTVSPTTPTGRKPMTAAARARIAAVARARWKVAKAKGKNAL